MTSNRIQQSLANLFGKHRILFWYDSKQELREEYEALAIPGVEKIELENNEYAVKHRILREQPTQKFLLYSYNPQPDPLDNWLLDVQLAHGEFRTDQTAIWLADLELGLEFADLINEHIEFFQADKRKSALRKLLANDDTPGMVRMKILAVCAGSEPRLDSILEYLLEELVDGCDDSIKLIERSSLNTFLWEQMSRYYGYQSNEPSIRDFVIELFKSCYAMGMDGTVQLGNDALVFLNRWKDSRSFTKGFEYWSNQCAAVLGIEQDLAKRDFRTLVELDYFELIDRKIISDLVREVVARTVSTGDVVLWVRQRRQGYWYSRYQDLYAAIEYAALFIQQLAETSLVSPNLSKAVQLYSSQWFKLDQLYRKYVFHARKSGQISLMGPLLEQVENLYTNNYLLKLGDDFQGFVDGISLWEALPVRRQNQFFDHYVQPYLRREQRVCVIVSDAMRYEIGDELLSLINQEDRYSAELEPMLSMLPSYTQLGMAALLPNTSLQIADNETATVLVDGQSSMGTDNRNKILKKALNDRGEAITADKLLNMNQIESRELLKRNDVIYIYHNRIDHTGDKMHSEGEAFEAAEQTLQDLLRLVKKLVGANASSILITADHGFIYQDRAIDESDFAVADVQGEQILYRDRRFVLGKGLKPHASLHSLSPEQLALEGEVQVQLPKSINRLRLKGSGSRFVHGGATLQEVVVPVLRVSKARQSDVSRVEVDILGSASSVITSSQLGIALYQKEPVTDKVQSLQLRAGIYTQDGELISDCHELTFDFTSTNSRERELQVRFLLSAESDKANGQEVILRLEEKHAGTTHYQIYKTRSYTLRRSFTGDFDF